MLQEQEIHTLPFVPLDQVKRLPMSAGIYFAIDTQEKIQYIGKAVNLKNRWSNHHKHDDLESIGGVRIAYLVVEESMIEEIEQALIAWFMPPLNKVVSLNAKNIVSRKNESITLSCTPQVKAGLIRLAERHGKKWGDDPNISKLIEAIGLGELKILDEPDLTIRIEVLEQDPVVQEYLKLNRLSKGK